MAGEKSDSTLTLLCLFACLILETGSFYGAQADLSDLWSSHLLLTPERLLVVHILAKSTVSCPCPNLSLGSIYKAYFFSLENTGSFLSQKCWEFLWQWLDGVLLLSILLSILLFLNQIFVFINSGTFSCFAFLHDLSSPLPVFSLSMSFLICPVGFLSELSYWNAYLSISIPLSLFLQSYFSNFILQTFSWAYFKTVSFRTGLLKAPSCGARERRFVPTILSSLHALPPLLLRILMMAFACLFFLHELFLSLPSGLILFVLVLVLMLGVLCKDL